MLAKTILISKKSFYECRLNSRVARHLCCEVDWCCCDLIIKIQKQDGGFWFIWEFSPGAACPPTSALLAGSRLVLLRLTSLLPLEKMVSNCRRIYHLSFLNYFTFVHALIWVGLRTCIAPIFLIFFLGLCYRRVWCLALGSMHMFVIRFRMRWQYFVDS